MSRIAILGIMLGLCGSPASLCAAPPAESKDYNSALKRAKAAWEQLQDPDLKPDRRGQVLTEARQNFRFAVTHAPRSTKPDELNEARANLAYLCWDSQDYYDAAVIGEFLARAYPDRPEAQQGAKIALAAYAKLAAATTAGDDHQFENRRMTNLAEFVTQHWPKSPTADESWLMLIRKAATERNAAKMFEYLGNMAADSPRRGETEIFVGQSLWAAYLEAARLPESKRPSKAELSKMLATTQSMLEAGVGHLRGSAESAAEASYPLVAAMLSLGQIALEAGQGDKAVAWLDDAALGPHTLVKDNNKLVDRGNFKIETLKAVLRAYTATQQLDKAQAVIETLGKSGGSANLTQVYVSLAGQLEASAKKARAEGNQRQAAALARGLASLLGTLASRPPKEIGFATLAWAAEKLAAADAIAGQEGTLSPEAADSCRKAADAYRAILKMCKADPRFAPQPAAVYTIQIRLARCLRRLGSYAEAVDTLAEVLKQQNNLLDAQREAAQTYQAWAAEKPDCYLSAIRGAQKFEAKDGSEKYLVWGWGGIARKVQFNESYRDIFFESRYNLALCRAKYAMTESGDGRRELLDQAARDITVVYKLYPAMGGKTWYDKFDSLLKKIQEQQGAAEAGLKGADQKSAHWECGDSSPLFV